MNTRITLQKVISIALMLATVGCFYAPDEYAFWRSQPLTADGIFLKEPEDIRQTNTKSEQQVLREPTPAAQVVSTPAIRSQTGTESDDKRLGSVDIQRSTPQGQIEAITSRAVPVSQLEPNIEPITTPLESIINYNEGRAVNDELRVIQKRLLREHTYAYLDNQFTRYVEPIDINENTRPLMPISTEGQSIYSAELDSEAYPVEEQISNAPEVYLPPNIAINDNIIGARDHVKERYTYGLSRAPADWPREYEIAAYDFGREQPLPPSHETLADGSVIIHHLDNVSLRSGSIETLEGKKFFFTHGSASLSKADKDQLKKISESLRLQSGPVTIVGHASKPAQVTDPIKKRMLNLVMSERRATEMARVLKQFGVESERINLYAFGDSYPNLLLRTGQSQEVGDRRVVVVY